MECSAILHPGWYLSGACSGGWVIGNLDNIPVWNIILQCLVWPCPDWVSRWDNLRISCKRYWERAASAQDGLWSDHFSKWPFERDLLNADKVFVKIMSSVKKYLKAHDRNATGMQGFLFYGNFKSSFQCVPYERCSNSCDTTIWKSRELFLSLLIFSSPSSSNLHKLTLAKTLGFVRVHKYQT